MIWWNDNRGTTHQIYSNFTKTLYDLIHTEMLHSYMVSKNKVENLQYNLIDWDVLK